MTCRKLTFNIIGYILILLIYWFLFSDMIPEIIKKTQDYLFGVKTTLLVFGIGCAVIGMEIKSCVSDYLWYKHSVKQDK